MVLKRLGVDAERCIHTHPVKRDADIRAALDFGLQTFVAASVDEIAKFEKYRHRASLLLRVSFRSPDAVVDLSRKFGCSPRMYRRCCARPASWEYACGDFRFTSDRRRLILPSMPKRSGYARD